MFRETLPWSTLGLIIHGGFLLDSFSDVFGFRSTFLSVHLWGLCGMSLTSLTFLSAFKRKTSKPGWFGTGFGLDRRPVNARLVKALKMWRMEEFACTNRDRCAVAVSQGFYSSDVPQPCFLRASDKKCSTRPCPSDLHQTSIRFVGVHKILKTASSFLWEYAVHAFQIQVHMQCHSFVAARPRLGSSAMWVPLATHRSGRSNQDLWRPSLQGARTLLVTGWTDYAVAKWHRKSRPRHRPF